MDEKIVKDSQGLVKDLVNDCISRQAAIDALRAMQTYKLFAGDDLLLIDQAGAQTELMMLPSAQPEKRTENTRKTHGVFLDVIDRQAAIDVVKRLMGDSELSRTVQTGLDILAPAQPVPKNGKWMCWHEKIENDSCTEYIPHCKCSECGTEYDSHTVKFINFCPNCGAFMKGE